MPDSKQSLRDQPEFFPKGAVAFFFATMIGFTVIWLALYWLLAFRQIGL